MADHPLISAATAEAGLVADTLLDAFVKRMPLTIGPTEDLVDIVQSIGSVPLSVLSASTGQVYFYDETDVITADDGVTCLVDGLGRRYKVSDAASIEVNSVLSIEDTPPVSPSLGDAYVVDVAPIGAWAANAKDIAIYTQRGWVFAAPVVGTTVLNKDTNLNIQYSEAGSWGAFSAAVYQPLDDDLTAVADTGVSAFSGLLYGLTLANNAGDATNDIDIAAGVAIDSTNSKFLKLTSGITKRLDAAWAVGTNQGGLDTGVIANTTYHVWLIMRSDTGVVDVLFSASASAPTMPTNYDYKRRIGSIIRAAAAIRLFVQDGDRFMWNTTTPPADVSRTTTLAKALTAVTVPSGIRVRGLFSIAVSVTTGVNQTETVNLYDGANTNIAMTAFFFRSATSDTTVSAFLEQYTNTSAQVYAEVTGNPSTLNSTSVSTLGWIDTRGRLG